MSLSLCTCGNYEGIMVEMSSLMRWSCFANKELWSVSNLIHNAGVSMFSHILAVQQTLEPILAC